MGEGKGGGGHDQEQVREDFGVKDPPLEKGGRGDLGKTITVQEGDTLGKLAIRVYGRVDKEVLGLILTYNPEIRDMNVIRTGWEIYFPPLPETGE